MRKKHIESDLIIKQFARELEDSFILKSKAARLLNELGGEKQKWRVCKEVAENNLVNLEGDSLIAASMVTYLAPFNQKTREYLFHKWIKKIADHEINVSFALNFNQMFCDPLLIKTWLDNGLSNDSYSI